MHTTYSVWWICISTYAFAMEMLELCISSQQRAHKKDPVSSHIPSRCERLIRFNLIQCELAYTFFSLAGVLSLVLAWLDIPHQLVPPHSQCVNRCNNQLFDFCVPTLWSISKCVCVCVSPVLSTHWMAFDLIFDFIITLAKENRKLVAV